MSRVGRRKKVLFCCVAALLGLLAIELLGRIAGLPRGSIRHLRSLAAMSPEQFAKTAGMFPPGFRGRIEWPPVLAFDVEIGSHGFRGPDVDPQAAPKPVVMCLGDSTTFGLYVDDDETYPHHLAEALPGCTVMNAGHPAWGLHDELRFLRERGLSTKPDVILHLVCINDFTDIGGDLDANHGRYAQKLERIRRGPSAWQWLSQRTAIGEMTTRAGILLRHLRKGDETIDVGRLGPIPERAWREFEILYARLADTCSARGIDLVTACLPCIESEPGRSRTLFEDRVAGLASRHGARFVAMDDAFRRAEKRGERLYLLPHDTHASAAGNRILATCFADTVRTILSDG